jgi:hypothetical protein
MTLRGRYTEMHQQRGLPTIFRKFQKFHGKFPENSRKIRDGF